VTHDHRQAVDLEQSPCPWHPQECGHVVLTWDPTDDHRAVGAEPEDVTRGQ
jgi:hypothetical protein